MVLLLSFSLTEEEGGSERESGLLKVTHLVNFSTWLKALVFLIFGPPLALYSWLQELLQHVPKLGSDGLILGHRRRGEHLLKCWYWVSSMKRRRFWRPKWGDSDSLSQSMDDVNRSKRPEKLIKQLIFKWSQGHQRRAKSWGMEVFLRLADPACHEEEVLLGKLLRPIRLRKEREKPRKGFKQTSHMAPCRETVLFLIWKKYLKGKKFLHKYKSMKTRAGEEIDPHGELKTKIPIFLWVRILPIQEN